MQNVEDDLNNELLNQKFELDINQNEVLTTFQDIAKGYTLVENCIAVLSDLQANRSYIYMGKLAKLLGLDFQPSQQQINSIWEDSILRIMHPEDLIKKHTLELQFFHFLKSKPIFERINFYATCIIRMQDTKGNYMLVRHRLFYVQSNRIGSFGLALCLYNICTKLDHSDIDTSITNSATGDIFYPMLADYKSILTKREKEILALVDQGKASKEIAEILSVSIFTINRHRQNILEKLQVKNSHEACQLAKSMQLI